MKNFAQKDQFVPRKVKRKYTPSEAEMACAKEAAASRLALEALQKELATAPQVNSFVIEETCTETTVENFIPHTDEGFIENLNEIPGVEVVNYTDLNNLNNNPLMQFNVHNPGEPNADKIKHILGSDLPSNVEIMFKTSDGNFVSVTDEVLQNITKGALQYQVIDENGHAGEIQELRVLDKTILGTHGDSSDFTNDSGNVSCNQTTFSNFSSEDSKLLLGNLSGTSGIVPLESSVSADASINNSFPIHDNAMEQEIPNESYEPELLNLSTKNNDLVAEVDRSLSTPNNIKCEVSEKENTSAVTEIFEQPQNRSLPMLSNDENCIPEDIQTENPKDDVSDMNKLKSAQKTMIDPESFLQTLESEKEFSPRKTRSNFKISEDSGVQCNDSNKPSLSDESCTIKKDKTKRLMPNRKRK